MPVARDSQDLSDWDMVGSVDAWEQVIDRRLNLGVALRSCALRYCDDGGRLPWPPTPASG